MMRRRPVDRRYFLHITVVAAARKAGTMVRRFNYSGWTNGTGVPFVPRSSLAQPGTSNAGGEGVVDGKVDVLGVPGSSRLDVAAVRTRHRAGLPFRWHQRCRRCLQ